MNEELGDLFGRCVRERGELATAEALRRLLRATPPKEARVLTIVANAGVHEIPSEHLRGDVFHASHGNWNVSTDGDLRSELQRILTGVAQKLKERPWQIVYLVPTGHPVVSMQIKTLVYRALRLNTIDLAYLNGTYYIVDLDQREIAIAAGASSDGSGSAGEA